MKILSTIIFFLTVCISYAQLSVQKSFGDSGHEIAFNVDELTDSTYVLTGYTTSFSSDKDIVVMNLDSIGGIIWTRTLRGEKIDVARKITATDDGGMILVGSTASFGAGRRDVFVAKLDKEGKTEWAKTYGGENMEYAFAVHPTIDGGYIISGETSSFGVQSTDILVLKIDGRGNLQWAKAIGGENVEYAFDALEHYDGYLVGFETNTWTIGKKDIGLLKLDKKGNFVWMKTYGGSSEDNITAMITQDDGSIAMVGLTASFGYGNLDGFFIKCDKGGNIIFSRTYGDTGAEVFQGIMKSPEGYVIGGFSNSFNDQLLAEDILLIKVNEKGRTKWSKLYGGKYSDVGLNMIRTSRNEILVVGKTESFSGRDDNDIYLVKNADNGSLSTCEQGRVQLVDQNAEFSTSSHEPGITDIPLKVGEAKFENKLQLMPDINICTEGETLVNEREADEQETK